ncbi:MAG TPA: hypothetical protein VFD70_29725 [Anaerolineae bacterium]|nr:hypothetical protein [Anaerolineae bacterium]
MSRKKYCPSCKNTKPASEFYRRRLGTDLSAYCKVCTNDEAINRQRRLKQKAIEYKGGRCQICGYDRCNAALEFHHLDKSNKIKGIGKIRSTIFEKVKPELDKTVLLCSNCHRELEAGIISLNDVNE